MNRLLAGAGTYLQGPEALAQVGSSLAEQGYKTPLLIAGQKAWQAAKPRLSPILEAAGVHEVFQSFGGHCTAAEVSEFAARAQHVDADCVLGVGGGKVLDLAKAAADEAGLPVFTVPTSAATCAAYAPLSIIYHPDGSQQEIRFFAREVAGVFVDTRIIAAAPARLLAAGLADAMAKSCEYASMQPRVAYGTLPLAKYLGYRLAEAGDEAIVACAAEAVESARREAVSGALEDAVFCAIACTGMVSGLGGYGGRGGARFAIAHAFNEVLRGRYFPPEAWLHGEVVAVGILAQWMANGLPGEVIAARRALFADMGIPVSLAALVPDMREDKLEAFVGEILQKINVGPDEHARVRKAVASVV